VTPSSLRARNRCALSRATGSGSWLRICAALLLALPAISCAAPRASAPPIAIIGGAIVDPDADVPPRRANIVIRGDRIVAVGPHVAPPRGARILDAGGKFLLPGLWDMHAHLATLPEIGPAPERYVGHGVLAVRDCGGYLDPLLALRRNIATGGRTGPQLFIAGPTLNSKDFAPFQRVVRDEAEARAAVRELAAAGVDFIKTHRATSREAFFAMLDETRRHDLHVAGHVPLAVSWIEAAEAGMRSMEHAQTLPENEMSDAQAPAPTVEAALARIDGERGDAIFAMLARTGAVFDPTLIHYEETIDDRAEIAARRREAYVHLKSYVGRAHRAGVTILAGTDVLERHGEMLLVELERLVESGLSPRQALAAATTNPARLMNRADLGWIAEGATASFLIVDADPTADVRHLRRLTTVLLRGRVIEKDELARLRAAN
jgi:imidazolonepropionase-like amidohydrolase